MGKLVLSSSDMITAAASSGLNPGRVWQGRSLPARTACSLWSPLQPLTHEVQTCQCMRGLVHLAQRELHCNPTGPLPSWERQALWVPLVSQGTKHC